MAGVCASLAISVAGSAVIYLQNPVTVAEMRPVRVPQMQSVQLVEAVPNAPEDIEARAAASRLLAELLNRQAMQVVQATQQGPMGTRTPAQPYVDPTDAASTGQPNSAQSVTDSGRAKTHTTGPTQIAVQQPNSGSAVHDNEVEAPLKGEEPRGEEPSAEAPPPPVAAPAAASTEEMQQLRARALSMIQQGDITSARLVLTRLAQFGDARAVFTLAETFDPKMLAQWNVLGIVPDPTRAKTYYSQAAKAGIVEARGRLAELDR
jgi:hypothetical protein